jgi:hypothetical protein
MPASKIETAFGDILPHRGLLERRTNCRGYCSWCGGYADSQESALPRKEGKGARRPLPSFLLPLDSKESHWRFPFHSLCALPRLHDCRPWQPSLKASSFKPLLQRRRGAHVRMPSKHLER